METCRRRVAGRRGLRESVKGIRYGRKGDQVWRRGWIRNLVRQRLGGKEGGRNGLDWGEDIGTGTGKGEWKGRTENKNDCLIAILTGDLWGVRGEEIELHPSRFGSLGRVHPSLVSPKSP